MDGVQINFSASRVENFLRHLNSTVVVRLETTKVNKVEEVLNRIGTPFRSAACDRVIHAFFSSGPLFSPLIAPNCIGMDRGHGKKSPRRGDSVFHAAERVARRC